MSFGMGVCVLVMNQNDLQIKFRKEIRIIRIIISEILCFFQHSIAILYWLRRLSFFILYSSFFI